MKQVLIFSAMTFGTAAAKTLFNSFYSNPTFYTKEFGNLPMVLLITGIVLSPFVYKRIKQS